MIRRRVIHIERRRVACAYIRPIAEFTEHVDPRSRSDTLAHCRLVFRSGSQFRIRLHGRSLRYSVRKRLSLIRQHANLIFRHIADQRSKLNLDIIGLGIRRDARLGTAAKRTDNRILFLRIIQHDDRQIGVIRLRHADALTGLRQGQIRNRDIAEVAAVIRARAALARAHIGVIVALRQQLDIHALPQRHIAFSLVALHLIQKRIALGLHQQRIIRHDTAHLRAERIQVSGLRIFNPAGNAADTHPAPFAFLASKQAEARRAVAQRHNRLRLVGRRIVKKGLFVGLSA